MQRRTPHVLRLKAEVRVLNERWIYKAQGYLISPERRYPLDVDNMSQRTIRIPDYNNAAILLTCRKIFYEATPTFYELNTIHHSVSTWNQRAIDCRSIHLRFLRRLSLDYCIPFPKQLCPGVFLIPDPDEAIANFLVLVADQCTNLEELTLYILLRQI